MGELEYGSGLEERATKAAAERLEERLAAEAAAAAAKAEADMLEERLAAEAAAKAEAERLEAEAVTAVEHTRDGS